MGNYITVAEVRAEGGQGTDAQIEARITKWEAIVEQLTGNVFRVIEPGELHFDGNNMGTLHFSIPLVEVTALRINDETVALPADQFYAYTGRTPVRDDRRNPRITLTPTTAYTSPIFRAAPSLFLKGYWQYITAKWGFVDLGPVVNNVQTYVTPPLIKDAVLQLVVLDLSRGSTYSQGGESHVRSVAKETTDGHSIEWSDAASTSGSSEDVSPWALIPTAIADVLKLYRRPPIITVPDITVIDDPALVVFSVQAW